MGFSDLHFNARFKQMGDIAERAFEEVYPQKFDRLGLDRATINLQRVPAFVRFSPDYATAKSAVEVQGFGRDQTIKVKDAKLAAQLEWHEKWRVDWFLFDSTNSRYGWVRLPELAEALDELGKPGSFDDGRNPFRSLKADQLPLVGTWSEYTPKTIED